MAKQTINLKYYPEGNILQRTWLLIRLTGMIIYRFIFGTFKPLPQVNVQVGGVYSFSGIDITAYIFDKVSKTMTVEAAYELRKSERDKRVLLNKLTLHPLATLGSIDINYNMTKKTKKVSGCLSFIIFDRSNLPLLKKKMDIYLFGQNEYGISAGMKVCGLKVAGMSHSICADEIINQESFEYTADDIIPWVPLSDRE